MAELVGMQHRIDESNYRDFTGVNGVVEIAGDKRHLCCKYGKATPGMVSLPESFKIIPRNEVASRSKDLVQSGADLISMVRRSKIKIKDQNGTNYCWVNCTASAIEYNRELQGEPYVELSPAFIGNMGSNFTNSGGYIEDALEIAVKYGCPSVEYVSPNNLSREWYNKNKEATFANAALHKITNWVNLGYARGAGSLNDKVRTCLLQRIPVVVALDWWSHAILYNHVFENFDWGFQNSWTASYGDKGMGRLSESKGSPSAAFIPASSIASLL